MKETIIVDLQQCFPNSYGLLISLFILTKLILQQNNYFWFLRK